MKKPRKCPRIDPCAISSVGPKRSRDASKPVGGSFDLDGIRKRIAELQAASSRPDFWADPEQGKERSQELTQLEQELGRWEGIERDARDAIDLAKVAEAEGDNSVRNDLKTRLDELERRFADLEFFLLFNDPHDSRNAIVAIHAGTGGTDAQDWAGMLLRMYLRFCERKGWRQRILDESRGQEAGIKSATFEVKGRYAYGHLKVEAGVHRLVRISPFDAEKMRHTSFALVEVLPELDEVEEVPIDEKDLRVDTFLSSGHGGQSVQTTYSAVRIVHLPTGITVTCQNERSQKQNRETAMKILRAKLHKINLDKQEDEKRKLRGEYRSAEWGNQIRSYVLQPYQMVKDHRTKFEASDVDRVLDGDLDAFIEASLRFSKQGGKKQ